MGLQKRDTSHMSVAQPENVCSSGATTVAIAASLRLQQKVQVFLLDARLAQKDLPPHPPGKRHLG
jgi:hypothetical protein